jgi:hypothetical protein
MDAVVSKGYGSCRRPVGFGFDLLQGFQVLIEDSNLSARSRRNEVIRAEPFRRIQCKRRGWSHDDKG